MSDSLWYAIKSQGKKMKRYWELTYLNSKLKIQTMTHMQDAEVFYEALCLLSMFYLMPNLNIQVKKSVFYEV